MLRAIREIQPRWVVGENVLGLVNWNGGLVFDEVQADLEAEGYTVQPYVLPACAVNAPHRRDRVWFVAYSEGNGGSGASGSASSEIGRQDGWEAEQLIKRGEIWTTPNPNRNGLNGRNCEHEIEPSQRGIDAQRDIDKVAMHPHISGKPWQHIRQKREGEFNRPNSRNGIDRFENFPTESPICCHNDGLPTELDGITFSKWRQESVKAYGNAIVPQVAYQIFKAIDQYECQASPSP